MLDHDRGCQVSSDTQAPERLIPVDPLGETSARIIRTGEPWLHLVLQPLRSHAA